MNIIIFGKKGCQKCSILKTRFDRLLSSSKYSMFDIESYELADEESIVKFCDLECLNFMRIPSFYIEHENKPLNPRNFGSYSLPTILGMQTNYEELGVITPQMLEQVLDEAKSQTGVKNE